MERNGNLLTPAQQKQLLNQMLAEYDEFHKIEILSQLSGEHFRMLRTADSDGFLKLGPCSCFCEKLKGKPPNLMCERCLCLFHNECLGNPNLSCVICPSCKVDMALFSLTEEKLFSGLIPCLPEFPLKIVSQYLEWTRVKSSMMYDSQSLTHHREVLRKSNESENLFTNPSDCQPGPSSNLNCVEDMSFVETVIPSLHEELQLPQVLINEQNPSIPSTVQNPQLTQSNIPANTTILHVSDYSKVASELGAASIVNADEANAGQYCRYPQALISIGTKNFIAMPSSPAALPKKSGLKRKAANTKNNIQQRFHISKHATAYFCEAQIQDPNLKIISSIQPGPSNGNSCNNSSYNSNLNSSFDPWLPRLLNKLASSKPVQPTLEAHEEDLKFIPSCPPILSTENNNPNPAQFSAIVPNPNFIHPSLPLGSSTPIRSRFPYLPQFKPEVDDQDVQPTSANQIDNHNPYQVKTIVANPCFKSAPLSQPAPTEASSILATDQNNIDLLSAAYYQNFKAVFRMSPNRQSSPYPPQVSKNNYQNSKCIPQQPQLQVRRHVSPLPQKEYDQIAKFNRQLMCMSLNGNGLQNPNHMFIPQMPNMSSDLSNNHNAAQVTPPRQENVQFNQPIPPNPFFETAIGQSPHVNQPVPLMSTNQPSVQSGSLQFSKPMTPNPVAEKVVHQKHKYNGELVISKNIRDNLNILQASKAKQDFQFSGPLPLHPIVSATVCHNLGFNTQQLPLMSSNHSHDQNDSQMTPVNNRNTQFTLPIPRHPVVAAAVCDNPNFRPFLERAPSREPWQQPCQRSCCKPGLQTMNRSIAASVTPLMVRQPFDYPQYQPPILSFQQPPYSRCLISNGYRPQNNSTEQPLIPQGQLQSNQLQVVPNSYFNSSFNSQNPKVRRHEAVSHQNMEVCEPQSNGERTNMEPQPNQTFSNMSIDPLPQIMENGEQEPDSDDCIVVFCSLDNSSPPTTSSTTTTFQSAAVKKEVVNDINSNHI